MPKIYENIEVTLESAENNLAVLLKEYERSLSTKTVSIKATNLTHEICTQLRSVLDRTAYRFWHLKIAPVLSEKDKKEALSRIYFPGGNSEASFDSTLGKWRLSPDHTSIRDYLLAQQPFTSEKNKWISVLFDLAVSGKHIDLVPQKRVEEKRTTVTGPGGSSISWGGGVKFSGSVTVMGAPIDPHTQRIIPTQGVAEKVEVWVSFLIEPHGLNAAAFCKEACRETRRIVQEMTDKFDLS